MKRFAYVLTATALTVFGVSGCATKNYVRQQTQRAIQNFPPITPSANKSHVAKHAEMLGDGRLFQFQRSDDVTNGPLGRRQETENVAAAGFGDGVENIRSGCGA